MNGPQLKVDIFHNVLWARYKGDIFKELLELSKLDNTNINIFQIAETELSRLSFGKVNRDDHQYQFQLLFNGPYEQIHFVSLCMRLAKALITSRSDIFVLPGYHRLEHWLMLIILRLKSKKVLVFCDSTALDNKKFFIKEYLKKLFFRSVDGVLCYGGASADYIRSYLPATDFDKIFYPCSSASLPTESYSVEQIQEQRFYLHKQPSKQFLFVGRLSCEKGILDLLNAWAASDVLRTQHILKIAGDGPQKAELQQKIAALGIDSSVKLLGACSKFELSTLYKESYAMVLPSYSEPWGLVVNEAYYFGCPVIMSESCGCHQDLCVDKYSQSFETQNVSALLLTLERLLVLENYVYLSSQCKNVINNFTPLIAARNILSGITKTANDGIN